MPMGSKNYRNPVWPGYFADPFVLKTAHGYYAYGTGPASEDGRVFPVLRSTNLVDWEAVGGALEPLVNPGALNYWAPEVAEKDGRFYLFYSASTTQSDEHHRLRVAIADHPAGPFKDSGRILIPQLGFTIDASQFRTDLNIFGVDGAGLLLPLGQCEDEESPDCSKI